MTSKERHEARYQRRKAKRKNKNLQPSFDEVFSFEHLYAAYRKCILGVGWKASVQRFKETAFSQIGTLRNKLLAGKWKSRGFYEFDRWERGKLRHIKSVDIAERVVQRCLCDYCLTPILTRHLIYDNSATIKGRGIHFAHMRLKQHLVEHYRKYGRAGYCVRYDMHDYFGSLPHEPLYKMLKEAIHDERILKLTFDLISNFGDKGLGLGSQVSQICAVFFMTKFDQYVVHKLGIKRYGRYMDDGYAVCRTKEEAHSIIDSLRLYAKKIGVEVNEKKCTITALSKGVLWLKSHYYVLPSGKILRKPCHDSIARERQRLKVFVRWVNEGKIDKALLNSSYESWQSWCIRCNAYRTRIEMKKYLLNLCEKAGITYE